MFRPAVTFIRGSPTLWGNTLHVCYTYVLHRDVFTVRIKNQLRQIVKMNKLTWIKIVKNLVLQREIYDDYCVQCWSSVVCRIYV
jgi:hypothetical protein